jgi:hypothetical protein
MSSFLFAFIWGVVVFFALAGWGWLLGKFLLRKFSPDLAWLEALGLAFSTVVGGLLDLTGAISKTSVTIYLVLGLCLFAAWLFENGLSLFNNARIYFRSLWNKKTLAFLFCLVMAATIFKYTLAVSPGNFNIHDDFQAYFVFPDKMLQTGHLGNDPFSERRMVSMLGGGYFLDTFITAQLGEKNLHLFDQGVMLLALLIIVWALARDVGVPKEHRLMLLLVVLFIDQPVANITSLLAGTVLFLAMGRLFYLTFREKAVPVWARAVLAALITTGLISLKSNFVPAAGILFSLYYFFLFRDAKYNRRVVMEFFLSGLLVLLLLSPWMVSMYQSSGTLFYPLLGKGFFHTVPGSLAAPNAQLFSLDGLARAVYSIQKVLIFALALLAGFYLKSKPDNRTNFYGNLALLISSLLGLAAIIYATGAIDVYRYAFPFLLAAFLALATAALSPASSQRYFSSVNLNMASVVFILVSLVVGSGLAILLDQEKAELASLKFALTNQQLLTPVVAGQHLALQQAVPAGEIILARLDKNYLFDFKRNPVYIIDNPGGVSLPPGMPFFLGSEPLAQYFLSHNIRYLAYSYKNQANFNLQLFGEALGPGIHPWVRSSVRQIFDFQGNLESLGQTRKRIYDDGNNFVLDLSQKTD